MQHEQRENNKHWAEGQPYRKIERADGENDPLGLFSDDRTEGGEVNVKRRLFCPCSFCDAVAGNFAVVDGQVELQTAIGGPSATGRLEEGSESHAQGSLKWRTAEVL